MELTNMSVAANTTPDRADSTQNGTMMLKGKTEGIGSVGAKMASSHIPAFKKEEAKLCDFCSSKLHRLGFSNPCVP